MRRTPDRRIMQSKRSLTSTSPLSFFLAFSKATTTKSHTLNTKKTHNVVIWFFTNLARLANLLRTYKRDTHNKWFYVFHIFFGVCIRKRSTPVWWSSVSVVLTPKCMCAEIVSFVVFFVIAHWRKFCGDINYINK